MSGITRSFLIVVMPGVGMSIYNNPTILNAARDVFLRDWTSEYAIALPDKESEPLLSV